MKNKTKQGLLAGATLLVLMGIVAALQTNEITVTPAAELILNGTNAAISLFSGTQTNFYSGGDTDDYLVFDSDNTNPEIKIVGGGSLEIYETDGSSTDVWIQSPDLGGYINLFHHDDGYSYIYDNEGDIRMMVDGDTDDYLYFSTESNLPYLSDIGGSGVFLSGSNGNIAVRNSSKTGTFFIVRTDGCDTDDSSECQLQPFVDNVMDLGSSSKAFQDIYYEGSITDTSPALAEQYYIDYNKSILQTELEINADGQLNFTNANPYLYQTTPDGNMSIDIGEATVENSLKITMLSKAVKRLYFRLCSKYPELPECDQELWEIIQNEWTQ